MPVKCCNVKSTMAAISSLTPCLWREVFWLMLISLKEPYEAISQDPDHSKSVYRDFLFEEIRGFPMTLPALSVMTNLTRNHSSELFFKFHFFDLKEADSVSFVLLRFSTSCRRRWNNQALLLSQLCGGTQNSAHRCHRAQVQPRACESRLQIPIAHVRGSSCRERFNSVHTAISLDIDLKTLEVTVLFFCQSVTHFPPPPPPLIPPPPPEIYPFFE
ncbi:MAG: hypothetical protein CM1200mP29_10790 [Verrucomicrobiota bacterium]|nr:MAG: hypothetical protein CM1200mP29_10790 [Verrucomicrobiota bacterium]